MPANRTNPVRAARPRFASLRREAEDLCRTVAGELEGWPLYIVDRAELPHVQAGDAGCVLGCTCPGLDVTLRPDLERLGRWRGRGPAMLVNTQLIRRYKDARPDGLRSQFLGIALHELAHVLDGWRPPADAAAEPSPSARAAVAMLFKEEMPTDPRRSPWAGHEASFLRTALHLFVRAAEAMPCYLEQTKLAPCGLYDIVGFGCYGISNVTAYYRALGDEPERMAGRPFAEILAEAPPAEFASLWQEDCRAWHEQQARAAR